MVAADGSSFAPSRLFPSPRSRDGGVDRIPLPIETGALWLCGKHAIGPDPDGLLERIEATTVVCLTERHEIEDRFPNYVVWLTQRSSATAVWFPIADLHAPAPDAAVHLVADLLGRLHRDESVLVHCAAGIGRAGTLACLLLVAAGLDVERAETVVAAARPMAGPEAGSQRALLAAWPRLWADRRGAADDG